IINGSGGINEITRIDGIFLILVFIMFMRHTFAQAKSQPELPSGEDVPSQTMSVWKSVLWVILGLAGLVWGGDRFVDGACGIARGLGVSEAVIGLTIVAAGTSLPELATSVVASIKGKTGIAVGNVVGSNIFNVFLVLGASATITPLPFGDITNFDLIANLVASVLFFIFAWVYKERTITRIEGSILTLGYIAYMAGLLF
ncbi:MAG: sodium:calcium antiporter, partial [Muribaculaceae bacterium]|nr:sodium:calcium antiporter [Muribaculaceae bacterium]